MLAHAGRLHPPIRWQGPRPPYRPRAVAELRAGIREYPHVRLVLGGSRTRKLPETLSCLGIAGDAVYDALVALAAKEHGAALATREARARGTYDAVGVAVIVVT
jgi:hypothetical protein